MSDPKIPTGTSSVEGEGKNWQEKVWQIDVTPRGESPRGTGTEALKTIYDSKNDLAPLRCLMYSEPDSDVLFFFSSSDMRDKDQTFELIINEKTCAVIVFRPDPEGGVGAEKRINRDDFADAAEGVRSNLIFRLRRSG